MHFRKKKKQWFLDKVEKVMFFMRETNSINNTTSYIKLFFVNDDDVTNKQFVLAIQNKLKNFLPFLEVSDSHHKLLPFSFNLCKSQAYL